MKLRMLLISAVACLVAASFATGGTTARLPTGDEGGDPTDLQTIAWVFNEVPTSGPEPAALGLIEGAGGENCGEHGHCSWTTCAAPSCPQNQSPYCTCEDSGYRCKDTHDGWNPFDNDEHATRNCTCGCTTAPTDPDPPEPPGWCPIEEPVRVCLDGTVELDCDPGTRWALPDHEISELTGLCNDLK